MTKPQNCILNSLLSRVPYAFEENMELRALVTESTCISNKLVNQDSSMSFETMHHVYLPYLKFGQGMENFEDLKLQHDRANKENQNS